MSISKLTFKDKNKKAVNITERILQDTEVNQIKYTINNVVDYINNFSVPVSSVNGQTGDVIINAPVSSVNGKTGIVTIDFPVSSVNGQTGDVNIQIPVSSVNGQTGDVNLQFPVSSVNGKTGNITLKTSDIPNDSGYITTNDIPVSSVNGLTGNVNLKMSNIPNDVGYITSDDILVSSVNGQTGNVNIQFPVLSVNGLTGHVDLNFPVSSVNNKTGNITLTTEDLENDVGYITSNDIPVSSVTAINTKIGDQKLTGHAKVFVPNKTSQLTNDANYYNNLSDFIKVINSVNDLANAEDGYLYVILQEEE